MKTIRKNPKDYIAKSKKMTSRVGGDQQYIVFPYNGYARMRHGLFLCTAPHQAQQAGLNVQNSSDCNRLK